MKKLLILLLALPIMATAKTPVNDDVFAQISNAESRFYYPNLMLRYATVGQTLTAEDYHYLYYGYAYQEDYKPLDSNEALDKLYMIAAVIDTDFPKTEDMERMIAAGTEALKRDPFSPKVLNLMAFAYGALGDKANEKSYYDRTNGIIEAIASSGDGLSEKTPKHILMFDHAIDVLSAQDFNSTKGRIISRTVEFVPLLAPQTINGKKVKGFYFDYSRVYWNKPADTTFKRERTWQFNNLKPREYK